MKKVLKTISIILAFSFVMYGCDNSDDEIQEVRVWSSDSEDFADAISEYGVAAGRKVGIVTDVGGIDDESFNQGAWEGMQNLALSTGADISYLESGSEADFAPNLRSLTDSGCELCWGVGYSCADALLECAKENPDVHYAIVDSSYDDIPDNVTGVVFRAQEPSFLVGYIAAAVSRSGKVGFVGGVKSDLIDQFQYGYMAGAQYAASLFGKDVAMDIEYADSYTDPERGYEIATGMFRNGCDVVYHAAGFTGTGVIEAAAENRRFVIGVDRDQSYLAPKYVLTSALKNVNVAVEKVSASYLAGEDIGGRNLSFGLTEGAVGIPEDHPNLRDEIYDSVLRLEDKIKAGNLKVPSNESEYTQFVAGLN